MALEANSGYITAQKLTYIQEDFDRYIHDIIFN